MSTLHASSSRGGRRAGLLFRHAMSPPKTIRLLSHRERDRTLPGTAFVFCPAIPPSHLAFPSAIPGGHPLSTSAHTFHLNRPNTTDREGTASHPITLLLNIHPSQVDPLLFPRQLPINPSLSRWCKWRLRQRSTQCEAEVRCSVPTGHAAGVEPVLDDGPEMASDLYSWDGLAEGCDLHWWDGEGRALLFWGRGGGGWEEFMFVPTARCDDAREGWDSGAGMTFLGHLGPVVAFQLDGAFSKGGKLTVIDWHLLVSASRLGTEGRPGTADKVSTMPCYHVLQVLWFCLSFCIRAKVLPCKCSCLGRIF